MAAGASTCRSLRPNELVRELARLGIDAGEPILICLETFQGHGDRYAASARWRVYRAPLRMGQQKDGTFIVPAIPGSMADKRDGGKRRCATAR